MVNGISKTKEDKDMTVKELKELIKDFADDDKVAIEVNENLYKAIAYDDEYSRKIEDPLLVFYTAKDEEDIIARNKNAKLQEFIINHYGFNHQLNHLLEELAELTLAIHRDKRDIEECSIIFNNNLIEELADVKNLIEQLEISSKDTKEGIRKNIEFKCKREIQRINPLIWKKYLD